MVDKGIIQYHHDFSGGVFPQRPLQKTEEGRCVVCPFFCTNDPTGFIIQGAYQFYPFVVVHKWGFFAGGRGETRCSQWLGNPGSWFRPRIGGGQYRYSAIFFRLGKVSSKNTCCFLESAFLRVYVGRVQLSPSR